MGLVKKIKGQSVFQSIKSYLGNASINLGSVDAGTVACNGTAEVTFTHSLGAVPTAYVATGVLLGSCMPVFKAVPTAVGGTLYSTGTGVISWMVWA